MVLEKEQEPIEVEEVVPPLREVGEEENNFTIKKLVFKRWVMDNN
jgi:hypothetical protein